MGNGQRRGKRISETGEGRKIFANRGGRKEYLETGGGEQDVFKYSLIPPLLTQCLWAGMHPRFNEFQ